MPFWEGPQMPANHKPDTSHALASLISPRETVMLGLASARTEDQDSPFSPPSLPQVSGEETYGKDQKAFSCTLKDQGNPGLPSPREFNLGSLSPGACETAWACTAISNNRDERLSLERIHQTRSTPAMPADSPQQTYLDEASTALPEARSRFDDRL
ncbi:hypothetical protein MMC14_002301 [Varicellaria rhodocarpa]|nr:hypothetical protein [Varicellaria rhodocarpa]